MSSSTKTPSPGPPARVPGTVGRASGRLADLRHRLSLRMFLAELLTKRWMEPIVPATLLVVLLVYFATATNNFATSSNLIATASELAEFSLVALGLTATIMLGGIDLSVGATFAVGNFLLLIAVKVMGLPIVLALVLVVAVGALMGAVNGTVIAVLKVRPLLTTLVTLLIFRSFVNIMSLHVPSSISRTVRDPVWDWLGAGTTLGLPTGVAIAVLFFVVGHVMLSRSRYGWHITAIGANRRAARRAGIAVDRTRFSVYVFSGAVSMFAGGLHAARVESASTLTGSGMEIALVTAVVLGGVSLGGGKGTVFRALIGSGVVVVLGKGLLLMNIPGAIYQAMLAIVLMLAVGIDIKWAKHRGKAIHKMYVNPVRIDLGELPDMTPGSDSPFAQNSRLQAAEALGLGKLEGPEDVIVDRQGRVYCGDRRGWINRLSGDDLSDHEVFARIGGLPLGHAFDDEDNLLVCVGGMGLYMVTPQQEVVKLTDETNRTWYRLRDDSRLRLADDLDVTPDGKVFFSEATTRFEFDENILDVLEGRPNGRLICYDPATATTKTVIPRLEFPNGVCSCHDGESLLIASSTLCKIWRYWHSGPKSGTLVTFMDSFPGVIDNINRASDGGYWVACNSIRSPTMDLAMRMPSFRRRMIRRLPPDEWLWPSVNHGCVVRVSDDGRPLESYWDPGGEFHATITSMREFDGHLYIGGLTNNRIGRLKLDETGVRCRCGQPPCLSADPSPAESPPAGDRGTMTLSEQRRESPWR